MTAMLDRVLKLGSEKLGGGAPPKRRQSSGGGGGGGLAQALRNRGGTTNLETVISHKAASSDTEAFSPAVRRANNLSKLQKQFSGGLPDELRPRRTARTDDELGGSGPSQQANLGWLDLEAFGPKTFQRQLNRLMETAEKEEAENADENAEEEAEDETASDKIKGGLAAGADILREVFSGLPGIGMDEAGEERQPPAWLNSARDNFKESFLGLQSHAKRFIDARKGADEDGQPSSSSRGQGNALLAAMRKRGGAKLAAGENEQEAVEDARTFEREALDVEDSQSPPEVQPRPPTQLTSVPEEDEVSAMTPSVSEQAATSVEEFHSLPVKSTAGEEEFLTLEEMSFDGTGDVSTSAPPPDSPPRQSPAEAVVAETPSESTTREPTGVEPSEASATEPEAELAVEMPPSETALEAAPTAEPEAPHEAVQEHPPDSAEAPELAAPAPVSADAAPADAAPAAATDADAVPAAADTAPAVPAASEEVTEVAPAANVAAIVAETAPATEKGAATEAAAKATEERRPSKEEGAPRVVAAPAKATSARPPVATWDPASAYAAPKKAVWPPPGAANESKVIKADEDSAAAEVRPKPKPVNKFKDMQNFWKQHNQRFAGPSMGAKNISKVEAQAALQRLVSNGAACDPSEVRRLRKLMADMQ